MTERFNPDILHVCVIGSAGFIGRAVARCAPGMARLRLLEHETKVPSSAMAEVIRGDARDRDALLRLIVPGAVVLNLAYLSRTNMAANVQGARTLLSACAERGATRIVHLSTAVVVGRCTSSEIDETTPCDPRTDYERAKLAIERVLLDAAPAIPRIAVLRPTAVFGPGGQNLLRLAERIDRRGLSRHLYACIHGDRRMNLVDVDAVAYAIWFLTTLESLGDRETFIISDDDSPNNSYRWVEEALLEAWATNVRRSPLKLPSAGLKLALYLVGRSNIDPCRRYLWRKLAEHGYQKPRSFETALQEYARWLFRVRQSGGDWRSANP